MKIYNIILLTAMLIVIGNTTADAASPSAVDMPVLNFSDLTQGPATGLQDGLGEGAIITIWGNNLGESQLDSTISVCGLPPSYIYYWKNADGQRPGGPANLYAYHKMQEIAFSLPSACNTGATNITVTTNGNKSNALPFTVREGNIYHVKVDGNNITGTGTFSNPWASASQANGGASAKISPGDIVYIHNGVQEINTLTTTDKVSGLFLQSILGSPTSMSAFISYPGASILARGSNYGIRAYQYLHKSATHIVISKWSVEAGQETVMKTSSGLETNPYGRIIGNNITGIKGSSVQGQQGAIAGNAVNGYDNVSGVKIFGNEIHDWGADDTSKLQHTTYLSNRSDQARDAWEWGWNYLHDNKARQGIHNYDEDFNGDCGDVIGTVKIHHNAIINQRDSAIDWSTRDSSSTDSQTYCFTNDVHIYNNLIVSSGLGPDGTNPDTINHGFTALPKGIYIGGRGIWGNIKIYNNHLINTGDSYTQDDTPYGSIHIGGNSSVIQGTVEIRNNLIINSLDLPLISFGKTGNNSVTKIGDNQYFYSGSSVAPQYAIVPIDDLDPETEDPGVSADDGYRPLPGSSVISEGIQPGFVTTDLHGRTRSIISPDIGVYESTFISYPIIKKISNKDRSP